MKYLSVVFALCLACVSLFATGVKTVDKQKKVPEFTKAGPFIKSSVNPDTIYPVDITKMNDYDVILLSTFQGIVARQGQLSLENEVSAAKSSKSKTETKKYKTQIYLYKTEDSSYYPNKTDKEAGLNTGLQFFKKYFTDPKSIVSDKEPSFKALSIKSDTKTTALEIIQDFRKNYDIKIDGYVKYNLKSDSQDMAVTVSGIKNYIPICDGNMDYVDSDKLDLADSAIDITGTSYPDFIAKYDSDLDVNLAIELAYDYTIWPSTVHYTKADGPKDYASMLCALLYSCQSDSGARNDAFDYLDAKNKKAVPIFGWFTTSDGSEGNFVSEVSDKGDFVVAADNSVNLSFFSGSTVKPKAASKPTYTVEYNENYSYIAFIISDGDNLQLVTNKANDQRWWGSEYRGDFPVGWTIPPALYYLEPLVWNYFVDSADPEMDEFVVGPSGIGFVFGCKSKNEKYKDKFRIDQITYLKNFMSDTGIETISIFGKGSDDWTGENDDNFLKELVAPDVVKGGFFAQFSGWMGQKTYSTQFVKYDDNDENKVKPVIPQFLVLDNSGDAATIAKKITDDMVNEVKDRRNKGIYVVYALRNDGDDKLGTMGWLHTINKKIIEFNNAADKTAEEAGEEAGIKINVVTPTQILDFATKRNDNTSEK